MTIRPSRLALATFTPAERALARECNAGRLLPWHNDHVTCEPTAPAWYVIAAGFVVPAVVAVAAWAFLQTGPIPMRDHVAGPVHVIATDKAGNVFDAGDGDTCGMAFVYSTLPDNMVSWHCEGESN